MAENVSPAPHQATHFWRPRAALFFVQGSLFLSECLAIAWLIDRILASQWIEAACLGQFALAMAAASTALYMLFIRRSRVQQPIERFVALLTEIDDAKAPIEDLLTVAGALAPAGRHVHELHRLIRTQRAMLTEMDHQVRQRIANRTEALERKIGSLTHQATRDALTGLLNRRALNEHLTRVIEASLAAPTPVSVLMIDVDNFKPLNDTLGHAAGDDLLRSIGQIFRSMLREQDAAFRCGGDEFVIVLAGCDSMAANALAVRLGETIDRLVEPLKTPAPPRLSIGAACLSEVSDRTAAALLHEADLRLYAVKGKRKREGKALPRNNAKPPAAKPGSVAA